MAGTKAPTVRELRRSAKSLGVTGWEEMDEAELSAAVSAAEGKAAKKNSTRTGNAAKKAADKKAEKASAKAPAKKAADKKASSKKAAKDDAELPENGNPFKEGTNTWYITEQLIKGGKRSKMVEKLKKQIDLQPRTKSAKDFDVDYEMDRRVLITGQILRNQHGFEVTREGRGADATIVAVAP